MSEVPTRRTEGMIARRVETGFTLLLPVFSVFFIWQATQVTEPPRNILVGPRTFPLLVGSMMLAVSVVLVWQHVRTLRNEARAAGGEPDLAVVPLEEDESSVSDWPAVWAVLGALVALVVTLESIGFVLALGVFLFGLSTFFARARWFLNLVVSAGFSASLYYLFTRILDIPLPNGVLGSFF